MKYQISAEEINQSETWIGGFKMSAGLYGADRIFVLLRRLSTKQ